MLVFCWAEIARAFVMSAEAAGFNSKPGAAKDCSAVANIDPDRALVILEGMPITVVLVNHNTVTSRVGKLAVLPSSESPS
jgi:hypothetical protein